MTRGGSEGPVLNGRIQKVSEKGPSTSYFPSTDNSYLSSRRKEGFHDHSARAFGQFLGPTSYSAVYRENQANLDDVAWNVDEDSDPLDGEQDEVQHVVFASANLREAVNARMNFGIRILSHFPERSMSDRLLEKAMEACGKAYHQPTIRMFHDSLWTTWGDNLPVGGVKHNAQRFLPLAQQLFNNEKKPLPHAKSTKDWHDGFLGENVRWEMFGLICGLFGLAILDFPETEPIFSTGTISSKRQCASIMTECAEACVVLCEEADVNNELAVWCRHVVHLLASQYNGDTSKSGSLNDGTVL